MPSFDIEVKETQWCLVEVEANTLEEALEKVNDMYDNGEIIMNVTHMSVDNDWEIYPMEEDWGDGEDEETTEELNRQEEQRDYEAWEAETEVERALGWYHSTRG